MEQLSNKRILLGITGGIAAYKSAELCRQFKTAGAEVRVVLTPGGAEFITPLTLQALSGNPVHQQLLDPAAEAGMGHIELAKWADLVVIAPASADMIARLAVGMGNDLLSTLCLATEAPIALAPAMNQAMWRDARTQANVARLAELGMKIWGPGVGDQACGDSGPGRMLEPEQLAAEAAACFAPGLLAGKRITITAGPTREAIDPVRYISNHSSGKMGYALAEAAREAGAEVTLVSGPVSLPAPARVNRIAVNSAEEMLAASLATLDECDIFVAAAAVADYRPAEVAEQKIKKRDEQMQIALVKNPDIISTVAGHARRPFCVGFAAETEKLIEHARGKLERKQLDLVVANDVSQPGIGFNSDDNAVTLIDKAGETRLAQASKTQLARELVALIARHYENQAT
ncbi:bifunctional phosphopantothenoylcysteine decarboxylase/phosphopantothenate--cysteine ligase CoaBC [Motiliproteus sp. SC1-56]|uniref:bifunctional phosphopantothenoylcysteine decarboxylase/phosphopantothenate--cysteine ligase CoaBC n=1 Tax=Motiliproteus sp. SC1-56 TaxID=2799565 RepID=UPI001A902814|nr:bifunctional phosphopantothenoylcysteine decarboxylase/phosphopantothenate--cysteine ligase CoaBC [Motiliproteus sp. SC1-56]